MLKIIPAIGLLNIKQSVCVTRTRLFHVTCSNEAHRKGFREKARKKKVKIEVQKVGFIPHNLRAKDKLNLAKINKHIDDSWKAIPYDNAYVSKYYRWRVFPVEEAIQCHRETHHPTVYNLPNAPLNVQIELNMQAEKKTRFVENFYRMAMIPHKFDHGEVRKILVFAKDIENQQEATKAGASLVGGVEVLKGIQNGEILLTEFHHVLAHPNMLTELAVVRGLLKRKYPNPRNGTLGINLSEMIHKFLNGINYSAKKDENQQDYGLIQTCVGTLDMDAKHLEENLIALLKDVDLFRPRRPGKFITRVLLKSPPSTEQLKIDPFLYVSEESTNLRESQKASDELDDTEEVRQEAVKQ